DPGRFHPPHECLQAREVVSIDRVGTTDVQRYSVLDDPVALQHPIEVIERLAAAHHEVFADDLEEVDRWALSKDVRVVRDAQPHADTQCGDPRCARVAPGPLRVAPGPLQVYFGQWWLQPPWPLHSFLPAQSCLPSTAQPPLPLHSCMPLQHALLSAAASAGVAASPPLAPPLAPLQPLSAPSTSPVDAAAITAFD